MKRKVLLISAVVVLLLILLVLYTAPFRMQLSGDVYSLSENVVAGRWELDLLHVRIPLLGHRIIGKPQLPEGCSPVKYQGGGYWHCYASDGLPGLHMLTAPVYSERDNYIKFLSVTYYPELQAATLYQEGTEYIFPASTEAEARTLLTAIEAQSTPN